MRGAPGRVAKSVAAGIVFLISGWALEARAEECVDCWTAKCPEKKAELPPCAKVAPKGAPKSGCPGGRVDIGGHCCWPGQDWGVTSKKCMGEPECPPKTVRRGEDCVAGCPAGMAMVSGHCCWPGQDWGLKSEKCIGAPDCPEGFTANRDQCVADQKAGSAQQDFEIGARLASNSQRRYEEAIRYMEKAVAADPSLVEAHMYMGLSYAYLGDMKKGAWHYEEFVHLAPGHTQTPAVLELLRSYYEATGEKPRYPIEAEE